jgi:predicted nucleic acid-binding protein
VIAATALANELPLYTHNLDDFAGLEHLIEIISVPPPDGNAGR